MIESLKIKKKKKHSIESKNQILYARLLNPDITSWPLTSRLLMQTSSLQSFFRNHGCTLNSVGIRPSSWLLSDSKQCQDFFLNLQNEHEINNFWVIKQPGKISCLDVNGKFSNGICQEIDSMPYIVKSLILRRQYEKRCNTMDNNKPLIQIERIAPRPLLVHSRRIKLHVLVLVASSNNPWLAFIHKGFVTLSGTKVTNNYEEDISGNGAAIPNLNDLFRETTEVRRSSNSNIQIWNFERFLSHLISFGYCDKITCSKLWNKIYLISKVILESSMYSSFFKKY